MNSRILRSASFPFVSALLLGACTAADATSDGLPTGDPAVSDDVSRILASARRTLGLRQPLEGIVAEAAVTGPSGSFRTHTASRPDGAAWLYQSPDLRLAIPEGDPIQGAGTRPSSSASDVAEEDERSWVRGHELHALTFFPDTRLSMAMALGTRTFASMPALAVRWRITEARTLVTFYAPSDTLPLGVRMEWTDPVVEVVFQDWVPVADGAFDGTRVFRAATFTQGDESFFYRYDRVTLGAFPDSLPSQWGR